MPFRNIGQKGVALDNTAVAVLRRATSFWHKKHMRCLHLLKRLGLFRVLILPQLVCDSTSARQNKLKNMGLLASVIRGCAVVQRRLILKR